MKHMPVLILAMTLALGLVTFGCRETHVSDARLTAADSLIGSQPDSALAMLETMGPADLPDEADRAYRGLLITQARYKCYITTTSDSDINRALTYYRKHKGEREKLTRAYTYKGAVMEELGHIDSAMFYYMQAEAIVAPDDYFNQGYAKLRIASLYREQMSQDSTVISRLRQAIDCFKQVKDTNYLISCYGELGTVYSFDYPDSAEYCLNHAIRLAEQFGSPQKYTYMTKLACFKLFGDEADIEGSLSLATDVIKNGKEQSADTKFYYYAVIAALKLGLTDSARSLIAITPPPADAVDSMLRCDVEELMAMEKNDIRKYETAKALNNKLTEEYYDNLKETDLIKAESEFSHQQTKDERDKAFRGIHGLTVILIVVLALLAALALAVVQLRRAINKHQQEKADIKSELEQALELLMQSREQAKKRQDTSVSALVSHRIAALTELYYNMRVKVSDGDNLRSKKIIPLSALLQLMNEKSELMQIQLSDSFWQKMRASVDGEFNGIVSFVENRYQDLSKDDIRLFCLYCARISPQIIMLCMGFNHPKTASNYKRKLIKTKMNLDMTFDEFVEKYMNGELD